MFVFRHVRNRTLVVVAASVLMGGCASTGPAGAPALSAERIAAIVASPDRSAGDRNNDARRKPAELLAFIGVRPGMVVLDLSAGGGYTSELLARAVGPTGRVYGQSPPPAAPVDPAAPPRRTSAMALAERATALGAAAADLVAVVRPFADPVPPQLASGAVDLTTLMYNYHDFGHMGVDRMALNKAVFGALKAGGLYVIADHAGRPGTGIGESNTLHRIEEDFVVREVEAAGFKLAGRGAFLRNPNDPRDRETPEPPQPKDEFVLKFVKPAG